MVDLSLADKLKGFGKLQVLAFSQTVKGAKDVFQIKNPDGTEISGVIGDYSVYFVLPKDQPAVFAQFEQYLKEYVQQKILVT